MKILGNFLKCVCALVAVLSLIGTIKNLIQPWDGDPIAMKESAGFLSLPIGGSFKGSTIEARSYAQFPISFSFPRMLYVAKDAEGSFNAESDYATFWIFGGIITYGWLCIYRFIRTKRLPGGAIET